MDVPPTPVVTAQEIEPETEEIVITQGNIHNPKAAIAAAESPLRKLDPMASEAARLT